MMMVTFALDARILERGPALESPPCVCGHELSLHQPDERVPGQLVATCDECGAWYSLVDINVGGGLVLMMELPRGAGAADVSEGLRDAS